MADQKVVLITAGTAGLGAAIARAFAPDHRIVINFANSAERASTFLAELNAIPSTLPGAVSEPRFLAVKADVGDKTSVQNLVAETVKDMGRLDVVISNAGWTRVTNFFELDEQTVEEDWDKCFLYNVKSHLWLFHAAKPHLSATEGGFVSTASLAGVKPSGSSVPYAVTKAAQIHLAKCLATISGSSGVRVNSVSPGLLLTEWGMKFGEEKIQKNIGMTKLGRLAEVEDVAAQVRTLALSRSITGQNVVVDCGTSL
jgi:NAD(P)-dependent dehydrogenase (short-subunit alcohol dehydrogenase family)